LDEIEGLLDKTGQELGDEDQAEQVETREADPPAANAGAADSAPVVDQTPSSQADDADPIVPAQEDRQTADDSLPDLEDADPPAGPADPPPGLDPTEPSAVSHNEVEPSPPATSGGGTAVRLTSTLADLLDLMDRPFGRVGYGPRRWIGYAALATLFAALCVLIFSRLI
jgi:hypothetical protein